MTHEFDIRFEVLLLTLVATGTLVLTAWLQAQRVLGRRSGVALLLSLLPSIAILAEYVPQVLSSWKTERVPAPYECIMFFPSLLALLPAAALLVVALRAIIRAGGRRQAYIPLALCSVNWLGVSVLLLEALFTLA